MLINFSYNFIPVSSRHIQHTRAYFSSSDSANIQKGTDFSVIGVGIAYTMVPEDLLKPFFSDCFITQNWARMQIGKARCLAGVL